MMVSTNIKGLSVPLLMKWKRMKWKWNGVTFPKQYKEKSFFHSQVFVPSNGLKENRDGYSFGKLSR